MRSKRLTRSRKVGLGLLILWASFFTGMIADHITIGKFSITEQSVSQRRYMDRSHFSTLQVTNSSLASSDEEYTLPKRVYLGVWQAGVPSDLAALDQFERDVGRSVAIVHWFQDWSGEAELNLDAIRAVARRGSISMITWEPWDHTKGLHQPDYRLKNIAAGRFDNYIRLWARGLAQYEQPILLRFAHEMNGWWAPWCVGQQGNTAEDYIAAWRHVHDIFQEEGAINVQWVWSPNIILDREQPFEAMFPGDEYVNWVALDGYNDLSAGQGRSFDELFGLSYGRITHLSTKSVMIAEIASAEYESSTDKATWITHTFTEAIPAYPRIKAVIWFNQNKKGVDWRISSSGQALQAFRQAINTSYYRSCYYCSQ